MNESKASRRHFLQVFAVGTVGTAGLCAIGCSSATATPIGVVSAGNVSSLATPSLQIVPGNSVAIGRDANGVFAVSLVCTHEQCDIGTDGKVAYVAAPAVSIHCNCHGSGFDDNGNVVNGPATQALPNYKVTIDGTGEITIDGTMAVAANTRVKV